MGHLDTSHRNWIALPSDERGRPALHADAFLALALRREEEPGPWLQEWFSGERDDSLAVNALDTWGTWRYADALIDHAYRGTQADRLFGDGEGVTSMGHWSDGTPVREATTGR